MYLLSYIRGDFVYCPVLLVLFKSQLPGLFTLHLKQIFIIRKYFTALLTVNCAFYLPFYEKRQKSSCIFGGYVV